MIQISEEHLKEMLLALKAHIEIIEDMGQHVDCYGNVHDDVRRLKDAYEELRNYYPAILREDDPFEGLK